MKKTLIIILAVILLALPVSLGATGYYEGFESGLGNWTQDAGSVTQSSTQANSGTYSMKIAAASNAGFTGFTFEGGADALVKVEYKFFTTDSTYNTIVALGNTGFSQYISYAYQDNEDIINTNPIICANCISSNTWYNITYYINFVDGNYSVSVDGVVQQSDVSFHNSHTPTSFNDMFIYQYGGSDTYIDDIYIEWTTNEVPLSYNLSFFPDTASVDYYNVTLGNGSIYQGDDVTPLTLPINTTSYWNFTITAPKHFSTSETNYWHNASASGNKYFNLTKWNSLQVKAKHNNSLRVAFNATLNGNSYSSSNGTLLHPENNTVTYSITNGAYFPKSGTGNNNLSINLYQSEISFNASEILTDNWLTGVTFTIAGNTDNPKVLGSKWYNVTATKVGYFAKTKEFKVNNLDNKTITVTDMSDTIINLTVKGAVGGASINNFSGYLYHYTTGTNVTFSTTSGYYEVPTVQGEDFLLQVTSVGAYATARTNITPNATIFNYTFSLFGYNSIFATFYDEITKSIINNVSLDAISSTFSNNYSTTNGTIYLTLLFPNDYLLRYESIGYSQRLYYLTIMDDQYYNLSLYLVNDSASDVTITILDQTAAPVEGAVLKVQKYDLATNTYLTVGMGETNSEGETIQQIVLNNEFYRFVVQYEGETLKLTTPNIITKTTLRIPVVIGEDDLDTWNTYQTLDYTLSFNNNTDTFSFLYNDADNVLSTICLDTYRSRWNGDLLLNSSCVTNNVGSILHTINSPSSGTTYYSIARAVYSGSDTVLGKETYTYSDNFGFTNEGLFIQLLLTLLISLTGLIAIELLPIAVVSSIIIGGLAHLHSIGLVYTMPLMIVAIILTYMLSKNG